MITAAAASLEEYLNTSYSPDREYVDGMIVERHVGELPHSLVQSNIIFSVRQRYENLLVLPEQRVRTDRNRTRIPDVCVTTSNPGSDVFESPPAICIEILSRRDEMTEVLEKLEEYASFGVRHIWLVDPRRKKAFSYRNRALREVETGVLTADEPSLTLPLEDVFRGL